MEGTVLHFDESTQKGVVRSENGDRFEFTGSDWASNGSPQTGVKVDFVAKDNSASAIYAISSPGFSVNVAGKLSDFQGSGVGQKISALFGNGLHNKAGLVAALVVLVTLFLPVIQIPFVGSGSLMELGPGKLLFILLTVLAIFFYGGATRLYTRILGGVILGILFFQYFDLFSGLNQMTSTATGLVGLLGGDRGDAPNFFQLVKWGAFVNVVACVVLFYATYIKKYSHNEKAI